MVWGTQTWWVSEWVRRRWERRYVFRPHLSCCWPGRCPRLFHAGRPQTRWSSTGSVQTQEAPPAPPQRWCWLWHWRGRPDHRHPEQRPPWEWQSWPSRRRSETGRSHLQMGPKKHFYNFRMNLQECIRQPTSTVSVYRHLFQFQSKMWRTSLQADLIIYHGQETKNMTCEAFDYQNLIIESTSVSEHLVQIRIDSPEAF